jgi:hypothetical protein
MKLTLASQASTQTRVRALVLFALIVCGAANVFAQRPPADDATRVTEFYRFAAAVEDKIWPNWSDVPAPLLLITEPGEFLTHSGVAPDGFKKIDDEYLYRARQFPTNLMATFPAFGLPAVIIIGEPTTTDAKTSTSWIMFAMHEHFHQLQYAQPHYYAQLQALGLSRGEKTGTWIINFPFPYENEAVNAGFDQLRELLLQTLMEKDGQRFQHAAARYVRARKEFMNSLVPDDRKYLEFQIGQEGIARYTQFSVAEQGASYQPSPKFIALPDYSLFSDIAAHAREQTLNELSHVKLSTAKRTAVYSFGAAEGLLLDRFHPDWKAHYFEHMFALGPLFENEFGNQSRKP